MHVMKKLAFFICENKGEDQLCSYCTADLTAQLITTFVLATQLPLYFFQNLKLLARFCDYTGQFVSNRVKNREDVFSYYTLP